MNNIYELLNNAEIDLDDYNGEKLSDHERKKAKKQITRELKKMKNRTVKGMRTSVAVAGLCVILGAGGVSVAAATNGMPITAVIKEMFGIDSEKEQHVISDMGAELGESAECQGYKVTVENAINDEKHITLIYRIEKADGSNLYEDEICTDGGFEEWDMDVSWHGGSCDVLEQEPSKKMIRIYDERELRESIKENEQIEIELKNLKLFFGEENVEVNGTWNFSIPVSKADYSVDLAEDQDIMYEGIHAKLEELTISPIGYSIGLRIDDTYKAKRKMISYIEKTGTLMLVLKNGEKIQLDGCSGPTCNDDDSWTFNIINTFDKLILREDMEKVIIGDLVIEL